jgi:hypothetical protein
MTPEPERWDFVCAVCTDDIVQKVPLKDIDGSYTCHACVQQYIVPLFQAALASEISYPVKVSKMMSGWME